MGGTADEDLYAALGVTPAATAADIRTAYRELAARYHPDKHDGNPLEDLATEKLARLNRAYEVLGDPARRAVYDAQIGGRNTAARAAPRHMLVRWLGALVTLLLVLRLSGLLFRLGARLLEGLAAALAALRGTPLMIVVFLAALIGGVWAIMRVTRKRRDR
jgi:DnaJ-domain-containing protein 1